MEKKTDFMERHDLKELLYLTAGLIIKSILPSLIALVLISSQ